MSDLGKLPISVLLLVRDEALRLESLLPRLGFAREVVVVVDAASRDASGTVARRWGARVFERPLNGFGAQRQFGLEQCVEEWILWLDADECMDPRAEAAVRAAVEPRSAGPAGYRLVRATWFLGRRIRHCGWRGERVLRLFQRSRARFDDAFVHERVEVEGPIAELPGLLEHRSYETWDDCLEKLMRYSGAGAERARRQGRRAGPWDVLVRPPLRFLRMYVAQAGFLDGAHGLVVCALGATQVLLKYAELWARPAGRGQPR